MFSQQSVSTRANQDLMCLAQGHNAVMLVRLEPTTPRSGVKHSTTEPLQSLILYTHSSLIFRTNSAIIKVRH